MALGLLNALTKVLYLLINFFLVAVSSVLHIVFSLAAVRWGYSLVAVAGFSLWWHLLLGSTGSRCAGFSSCARGFRSCGLWALVTGSIAVVHGLSDSAACTGSK